MSKKPVIKKTLEMQRISIPIYRETLNIFFGPTEDAIAAAIADKVPDEAAECALRRKRGVNGMFRYIENEGYYVIWLPEVPKTIGQFGVLIHELEHFLYCFMDVRGIPHTNDSDEAYAYLFEFLYCESMTIVNALTDGTENK